MSSTERHDADISSYVCARLNMCTRVFCSRGTQKVSRRQCRQPYHLRPTRCSTSTRRMPLFCRQAAAWRQSWLGCVFVSSEGLERESASDTVCVQRIQLACCLILRCGAKPRWLVLAVLQCPYQLPWRHVASAACAAVWAAIGFDISGCFHRYCQDCNGQRRRTQHTWGRYVTGTIRGSSPGSTDHRAVECYRSGLQRQWLTPPLCMSGER